MIQNSHFLSNDTLFALLYDEYYLYYVHDTRIRSTLVQVLVRYREGVRVPVQDGQRTVVGTLIKIFTPVPSEAVLARVTPSFSLFFCLC